MYFSKKDLIFGSEFLYIEIDTGSKKGNYFTQDFKLGRALWKNLDTNEKRCNKDKTEGSTTECITRYLERSIGCSMGLAKSDLAVPR